MLLKKEQADTDDTWNSDRNHFNKLNISWHDTKWKGELINVYFCVCSDTSRKPKKGDRESRMYAFTSRSKMETDIKNGRYLEHGEYDGNLYGIKIDSIHEVVEAGRICILDANPQVRTWGYFAIYMLF